MAPVGRDVSMLSGYAPAPPTPFAAMDTITQQTKLPPRPDPGILSEVIPLFFIGRNEDGFWVAREAAGRAGGIFLRKQSALRFANRITQPGGCATMLLSEHFELDVENKGNPLVAHLAAAKRLVSHLVQRLTAPAGKMAQ
jgi:hypothetical protein